MSDLQTRPLLEPQFQAETNRLTERLYGKGISNVPGSQSHSKRRELIEDARQSRNERELL